VHSSKVERWFPKPQIWVRVLLRLFFFVNLGFPRKTAFWFNETKNLLFNRTKVLRPEGSLDTFAQRAKGRQHFGVYAKGSLDTFGPWTKRQKNLLF
jgi:hypothetical protein